MGQYLFIYLNNVKTSNGRLCLLIFWRLKVFAFNNEMRVL